MIVSFSFITTSLALKMCPETIPTVSIVNRCPSNATEWVSASKRKSCNNLGHLQSCTKADDFVYHCVLNKDATMLVEVCAPTYLMSGYCARFSEVEKRIIIDTGLDCTKFNPPCSTSFLSNESYNYQTCYRNVGENLKSPGISQDKNVHVTTATVTSIIFAIIILLLLIVICVGYKLKMKKFACTKISKRQTGSGEEEMNLPIDNNSNNQELVTDSSNQVHKEEEKTNEDRSTELMPSYKPPKGAAEVNNVQEDNKSSMKEREALRYKSLSGDIEGEISLKGVKTIYHVREKVAEKLKVLSDTLYVVNEEHGMLWDDDKEIKDIYADTLSIMIVLHKDRMKQTNDGCSDSDRDNEDHHRTTQMYGGGRHSDIDSDDVLNGEEWLMRNEDKCRCRRFKGHWFGWTRQQLLEERNCFVKCEKCKLPLDFDEIVKKCKMTPDEQVFFQTVIRQNNFHQLLARQMAISGTQSFIS